MQLREVAHTRSGDKGDVANISVIAYDAGDYAVLEEYVTAERVRARVSGLVHGEVVRYTLPHLGALNFVLYRALGGGVTRSLALDAHGKCLSAALLDLELPDRPLPASPLHRDACACDSSRLRRRRAYDVDANDHPT